MKTLSKAVAIASLLSAGVMGAQVANAEVSYSAGIATTYLWRGTDLGGAQFSAAADYSHDSGAYAGIWVASGDLAWGNEYDLYVGFAKEFGDFSVDLMAATYTYSSYNEQTAEVDLGTGEVAVESTDGGLGSPGENSEAILSLGYMDASVSYTTSLISGSPSYIALGYSVAGVDLTYGMSDNGESGDDAEKYSHFDVSYAFNDSLAITVSQPIEDTEDLVDTDTIVVMSYSLPL